ncbi:MAG: CHRD domain-containing protein, partial [Catalinimonas sp.]
GETGFHLHAGMAGRNGGIAVVLNPALDGDQRGGIVALDSNTAELTDDQLAVMFDRGIYANIHSEGHPGGEIRGQVLPEAQYYFQTYLSGTQEVKPVPTTGTGFVIVEVRGDGLTATGSFDDLTSDFAPMVAMTGAHLHRGFAGQNGGVDFFLNPMTDDDDRGGVFMADSNMFMATGGQDDTLRMRGYYVNIHSDDYPGGEVRGQLLPEATAYFVSTLSGASENPAVMSDGFGTLIGEVQAGGDTMLTVTGMFQELGGGFDPTVGGTGAHLHLGIAGRNGGIAVDLSTEAASGAETALFMADDNMTELDAAAVTALRSRMIYTNIHSLENPTGEVRGQMLPPANAYLTAKLSGNNEVQPVMSGGMGGLKLELNGDMLTVTGSFQNLDSTYAAAIGAHLHEGGPDENGPVIVPLTVMLSDDSLSATFMADSNMYTVEPDTITALLTGGHYANVHSLKYPTGELRGQVLQETNFFPAAAQITSPADDAELTIAGLPETEFTVAWDAADDPDGNEVVYLWQLATADDFMMPLVNVNVGTETSFTATFEVLDSILASAGLAVNDEVMLFHRVVTSDGSLMTPDMDTLMVTLTRGVVSSVTDLNTAATRLYP